VCTAGWGGGRAGSRRWIGFLGTSKRRRCGSRGASTSRATGRSTIRMVEAINPSLRLLMGPGPINGAPRVLRVMAAPLLGQFDPEFRRYMTEVSELYRGVFQTRNRWTLLIDGTARAGIEAALVSLIEPGDRVLVPVFGRFG